MDINKWSMSMRVTFNNYSIIPNIKHQTTANFRGEGGALLGTGGSYTPSEKIYWSKSDLRIHKRTPEELRDLAESFCDFFSDDDILEVCKKAYWTSHGAIDNYRKLIAEVRKVRAHKNALMSEYTQLAKKEDSARRNVSKAGLTPEEKAILPKLESEIDRLENKAWQGYGIFLGEHHYSTVNWKRR